MAKKDDDNPMIPIEKINFGGLAYSKWSGIKNSMHKLIGLDMHSIPGIIQAEYKLTKDTATTVDELCLARLSCSNGSQFWGSSTSGKIWECTSAGAWRLVHTITPAAGAANILDMEEYKGYIYIATQSRLHRITVADSSTNDWATDCVEDWATFGVTDDLFHPMLNHPKQEILYIGDGNQVAQVDAGVFSANALDITTPLRIKTLGEFGTDVLVGTWTSATVTKGHVFRWNGWSSSFTNFDTVNEVGINAFLKADNETLISAGTQGNIYSYDGTNLNLFLRIPGTWSSASYGSVSPQSVGNVNGQMLFGLSNGSGNPAEQGVYRIARHDRNFPYILDFPYPISERSDGAFVTSSLTIGGILVVGSVVYVAWKNGSSYGIDKLDTTARLDGAYMDTRVMILTREVFANLSKVVAAYASMPANTAINFYTSVNYAAYGSAMTQQVDTQRNIVESKNEGVSYTTMQLRIKFTCSGTSTPLMESAAVVMR